MMKGLFQEVGAEALFFARVMRTWIRHLGESWELVLAQVADVGSRSLATVCFAGFFVGAILVIQFHLMLSRYDAVMFLGGLNTSATVREIGPLIISFLLAGKVGAYTAAELGTMRVTEQIDAVSCLGTDPLLYLVVPRFLAIVICSMLLLVFGLMVGICGSMLVAAVIHNVNFLQYLESVPKFTDFWTVTGGVFKCLVYGIIVANVATFKGFTARGGARGVGRAVTESAVYTNLFIVLANFVTSQILGFFEGLTRGAY
jgi:phospholipid/cholesterol/gamma-HCH transport system permease protein